MQAKYTNIITLALCGGLIPIVLIIAASFKFHNYLLVSYILIFIASSPFILTFEKRRPQAREIVVIAVMVATGVIGRLAFSMLPQFKPVIAIIIITALALGPQVGFITGALTALVSNIFMGQASYTPWQMFSWGLVGLIAGLLMNRKILKHVIPLCVFGILMAFLSGAILDTYTILYSPQNITKAMILWTYSSGFPFNAILAGATAVFLLLLAKPMSLLLYRIKQKYGF